MGMKDNFWQMGDTGPCGPCSEIHYDMGIAASDAGHTDCQFPCECGRYVEIWNLVFMQFDKSADGKFNPLPKPSIDTGAGLERVTAVLQGVISNYDTDLFVPLIKRAAELTGTKQLDEELKREDVEEQHHQAASLRVIADHARAATFLISDGVLPIERRPRLRAAQNHPSRHPSRTAARAEKPFLLRDGLRRSRRDEGRVSGTDRIRESRCRETIEGVKRRDSRTRLELGTQAARETISSYIDSAISSPQ